MMIQNPSYENSRKYLYRLAPKSSKDSCASLSSIFLNMTF